MLHSYAPCLCYILMLHFFNIPTSQISERKIIYSNYDSKRNKDVIAFCTSIFDKTKDFTNWHEIFKEFKTKNKISLTFLSTKLLPRFLNSKIGFALINILRIRELDTYGNLPKSPLIAHNDCQLRTAAYGLSEKSDDFWFQMFQVLSHQVPFGTYVRSVNFVIIVFVIDSFICLFSLFFC